MNSTAAPVLVNFPKLIKCRLARRPVLVGDCSKSDLTPKGGTPETNGGRDFPLPPPPRPDGSPCEKRDSLPHAVSAFGIATTVGPKFNRAACACVCSLLKWP